MKILRRHRTLPFVQWLAAFLVTLYVDIVWLTCRWKFIGEEFPTPYWKKKKPLIACFWHGRLLIMFKAWHTPQKLHMLSSTHPDGEIVGRVIENFGFGSVLGSSTKGGKKAFLSMVKILHNGESVGITPDGPRGPRHHISPGVIRMARLGKADILPLTYSVTKGTHLKTWDKFLLPFPFGRGVFIYGPVMNVSASSKTDEELQQDLETTLRNITQQADAYCGRKTV